MHIVIQGRLAQTIQAGINGNVFGLDAVVLEIRAHCLGQKTGAVAATHLNNTSRLEVADETVGHLGGHCLKEAVVVMIALAWAWFVGERPLPLILLSYLLQEFQLSPETKIQTLVQG